MQQTPAGDRAVVHSLPTKSGKPGASLFEGGVDDGTRTRDGRNHNPGLYQLSYVHHGANREPAPGEPQFNGPARKRRYVAASPSEPPSGMENRLVSAPWR